jgi:hypothetical protein
VITFSVIFPKNWSGSAIASLIDPDIPFPTIGILPVVRFSISEAVPISCVRVCCCDGIRCGISH